MGKQAKIMVVLGAIMLAGAYPVRADTVWLTGHHEIVDGEVYGEIYIYNDVTLDILGGDIFRLAAYNTTLTDWFAGEMDTLWTRDDSIVNIFGGQLGGLSSQHNSVVNLCAYDIVFEPSGGYDDGWIYGKYYADDSSFAIHLGADTYVHVNIIPEPATTYYVNATDGDDNNNGLSPQTPFATIQKAIDSAFDGDTVIVADGTYTGPGNRDIDFLGKAITVRSESGPENCIIDCNGTWTEPHRGFYFQNNENADSVLDGFTITNGYAPGDKGGGIFCDYSNPTITGCKIEGNYAKYKGGAMYNNYSNPSVNDCTFSGNSVYGEGGGMFNYHSNLTVTNCTFIDGSAMHGGGMHNWASSPIVTNCLFSGNSTSGAAGGMFNRDGGSPTVRNCKFIGNSAGSTGGGMFNFDGSNSVVVNCLFSGNSANGEGGGMYNCSHYNGPAIYPTVVNCTFSGNFALMDGGGIYDHRQANPILVNCILWGNSDSSGMDESAQIHKSDHGAPVVNYCCVQGWTGMLEGRGNIGADPAFVYPATGNYHLLPNSPCIDAGDPNYIPEPNETDLDGNPRIIGGRVDMGAYEFNHLPIACIVGGDRAVEVGSGCEARVTLDGSCSSDVDSTPGTNDNIEYFDWYEQIDPCDPNNDIFLGSGQIIDCNLSLGEHDIILEVIDKAGAFDTNEVTIIVEDTTPPEFSLTVSPDALWPPNHKMVLITPSWEISDNCDESPEVTLVSITSNEDDDAKGNGHTANDIQVNDNEIWLRAERSRKGTGRVYTITYQAVDDSGNVTLGSATVTVPHDRTPPRLRRISRGRLRHMLLRRLRDRVRR